MNPEFSICIPNFNYEAYLGKTLQSAVDQDFTDLEIVVADNASTDSSVEILKRFQATHANIYYKVNACNVGFAGNLDECGRMAKGNWMIMLSSDDMMAPEALSYYDKLIRKVNNPSMVVSSTFEKIGPEDEFLDFIGPVQSSLYHDSDIDSELSEHMGCNVYKIKSDELLKRCLPRFYNPFNFAATCYPREAYVKKGGYGGSRMMNPDKWFHWKLLAETEYAYIIDKPLFKYRWHNTNQTAQLKTSGALKFWVDEYRNSFEPEKQMLAKAGLTGQQMQSAFCDHILKYVVVHIRQGEKAEAWRLFRFVQGVYPSAVRSSKFYFRVATLLRLYPLSKTILSRFK